MHITIKLKNGKVIEFKIDDKPISSNWLKCLMEVATGTISIDHTK